ncbi:MAG: rod shape-determining protein RodA [SAR324 cluster bacterium]|nr:rod shape-determining protein RodA [SAR324 cluster bacterium]MBL7035392.1 rod shape-determining protein RodA [SAR324 cluster bacterium]
MFDQRLLANIDWTLCFLVLLISGVGLVALSSATVGTPGQEDYLMQQVYRIVAGIGVIIMTQLIHYRNWARLGFVLHLVVIGLLVLVLFYGTGGPGAPVQRWLKVGPFFFQPSEFSKFTLILALSHHFRDFEKPKGDWLWMVWPLALMVVPVALIIKQPDLGTAMLLVIVFAPIIFLMGIRFKTIFVLGVFSLASLPIVWLFGLKSYQKGRILTFLDPERDPLGSGYHIIQSKIAIGSGGLFGKGFGEGTQGQLNFLPAHHTDFIFSVFSEEWGFVGAMLVLVLFLMLALWSLAEVLKAKNRVSAIQIIGIVSIIISHVLINIGMTTGLMPVVGVPLPFFSYGGSSMLSMMFGIGLLLNIRMRRFEKN